MIIQTRKFLTTKKKTITNNDKNVYLVNSILLKKRISLELQNNIKNKIN